MDTLLGLLALLGLLLMVAFILLVAIDFLILLGYLVNILFRMYCKSGNIKSALALPEGVVFDKKNKSVKELSKYIEDILVLYERPENKDTQYRMGANLHKRIENTRQILSSNGISRKIRFVDVRAEKTGKGHTFRKWDQGGKEWGAAEINASMVEQFIEVESGRVISQNYYPSVKFGFSMSRRLKQEDRVKAAQRDKWGRKLENKKEYYKDEQLKFCSSCGAELPGDLKDVVCPYCGSTIFSDYYDWQIESLEIEPQKLVLRGLIGWSIYFRNHKAIGSGVNNKKKQKIVRFSENDFRQDVYESIIARERNTDLIDMWLGTIDIRSIKNTEKDTILKIKVPIYRIMLEGINAGSITIKKDVQDYKATFTRVRYPNRFRKEDAVVSQEKMCPTCGGPFTPDEKGNCKFCQTFLFKDNVKWKQI